MTTTQQWAMVKRDTLRPGDESVWDYPRPPACEPMDQRLRVMVGDEVLAETTHGHRVLETSHPPVYYFPQADVRMEWLRPNGRQTRCEWKGVATSYDLVKPVASPGLAWQYRTPSPGFEAIAGHLAFYAGRVGACFVGDEEVVPQPGGFYGGWITARVKGPFKGIPGSMGW